MDKKAEWGISPYGDMKKVRNLFGNRLGLTLGATALSLPMWYYAMRGIKGAGGLPKTLLGKYGPDITSDMNPLVPALILTGITGLGAALQFGPRKLSNTQKWLEPFNKKAQDLGYNPDMYDKSLDLPLDPIHWARPSVGVRELKKSIWENPSLNEGQRQFLDLGVNYATGGGKSGLTSFSDLTNGNARAILSSPESKSFGKSLLQTGTRLAEGAFIAKAFAPLAGLGPESTTWAMRINSITNALNGSEFFRRIK